MPRLSGRALQLYSGPGAGPAARAISKALTAALRALRAAKPRTIEAATNAIGRAYQGIVYPVLAAHAQAGACDTEPRGVVVQALVSEAKRLLGLVGYYPELADAV